MLIYVCFALKIEDEGMIALRAAIKTEAFTQRYVAPQERQNCIYCLNFLKKKKINDLFGAYRTDNGNFFLTETTLYFITMTLYHSMTLYLKM